MNEQIHCTRCGAVNATSARFCQQCGNSLLGPAGAKGVPNTNDQQPVGVGQPQSGGAQVPPSGPGQPPQNWNQTILGGLAGFLLGSMFGGGRGLFGGWGGGRDWDDGGGFGGDGGGWGDGGGGDFGGGGGDG
jgi:hypothetical protein